MEHEPQNVWEMLAYVFLRAYEASMWAVFHGFYPFLWWLWNLTPAGWPVLLKIVPFFLVPFALFPILRPFAFWRRVRGSALFGSARWANLRELRRAGMLRPGGRFLGVFRGRDLYLHGEGHCLTVAAQGGGKTTGLIIPTLLTYRAGPVIVTDPKGAITAQTARFRRSLGRVVVLNPWRDELAQDPAFGLDLGDDGMNPLQAVGLSPEGRQAASLLAALLLPDMPGEEAFWRQEGRELLEWGMLWQAMRLPEGQRTLPRLRGLLYDLPELVSILEAVTKGEPGNEPGARALRDGAGKFYGLIAMGAGAQLSGVVGTATTALKIYDQDTRLAGHVSRDGFRLSDLKAGEPLTLFVICPPDHLVGDDRKWLNLVLALICQQIGRPGRAVETVLLADEFPALGYLPNLAGALEQFREAGLRAHLIAQNVGQILTIYGQDGLRRFWGACENKQFFRITDPEQARLLSSWIGERTERQVSRGSDGRETVSLVGVPLVRPDELLRMRGERQVIIRPELPPIRAAVVPFFKRGEWAGLADSNPYRHGAVTGAARPADETREAAE